jgi:hypothetical protein
MTEHEARELWMEALLRHERFIEDGGRTLGDIHEARNRYIAAETVYRAVSLLQLLKMHDRDKAIRIAERSVAFNLAQLTSTHGG